MTEPPICQPRIISAYGTRGSGWMRLGAPQLWTVFKPQAAKRRVVNSAHLARKSSPKRRYKFQV
jgi:hypothetical protein